MMRPVKRTKCGVLPLPSVNGYDCAAAFVAPLSTVTLRRCRICHQRASHRHQGDDSDATAIGTAPRAALHDGNAEPGQEMLIELLSTLNLSGGSFVLPG